MRWTAILILVSALFSSHANAQVSILGIGRLSCKSIAGQPGVPPEIWRQMLISWSTGFLSGVNTAIYIYKNTSRDLTPVANADYVIGSLSVYCLRHPDQSIANAVEQLFPQ